MQWTYAAAVNAENPQTYCVFKKSLLHLLSRLKKKDSMTVINFSFWRWSEKQPCSWEKDNAPLSSLLAYIGHHPKLSKNQGLSAECSQVLAVYWNIAESLSQRKGDYSSPMKGVTRRAYWGLLLSFPCSSDWGLRHSFQSQNIFQAIHSCLTFKPELPFLHVNIDLLSWLHLTSLCTWNHFT